jgi:hypothetical protein
MQNTLKRYLVAAAAGIVAGCATVAVEAAGEKIGDTQMCVPLQNIDSTPVIDDKTILIKMRGNGGYKRIDLVNRCSGLRIVDGFGHSTSTNDLCTTDPLRVLEPVGATCMIDKIVTIDKDEAKALMARR